MTAEVVDGAGIDLLSTLKKDKYDLIQTDEALRKGAVASLASEFLNVPHVLDIQGWADYLNTHGQYGPLVSRGIKSIAGFVFSRADGVIFVSRESRRQLQPHFPLTNWRYAKPVFDVSRFSSEYSTDNSDTLELLTVTNLRYEEKLNGVKTVLRSLEHVFPDYDIKYRIAGGGQSLTALKEFVDSYEYADRIEVLGFRDDVTDLLSNGDIFVYVSYLDSLAMTVLEAEAAGLPVIASDTGGIPEAVGDAGIVVPPTPTEIAESVQTLLENPGLRVELSKRARDRMSDYRQRQAVHHVELWETMLEE
ncbi:glycosyltransferase family 4 protein [Halostella sp. JP-L12]|uniref:glycosyltransferase family 4 protein n=1 Tax=Halostella TaxID=1843185 RepID=UPI0013CEC07D|nr:MULTISPECIES: glycosyltransferase family 4 protein [Halostella]NHN46218.1 glycosyltransferase family 4 protein [Halostella sp. JP-L12]